MPFISRFRALGSRLSRHANELQAAARDRPGDAVPPMPPVIRERTMRVFVSSTFRDMQADREELVKRVFPQLRKRCEQRGVIWGEVDLRWGVTDEQRAERQVLPICLAEIQHCRPYFIGLLADRYGWIPDDIDANLAATEPWLNGFKGRSVTELEVLHGVLNNPEMAAHAYFYFRDPRYVDSLPAENQPYFGDAPTREETDLLGPVEANRLADSRKERLADLKTRIRASGFPVREDYPDPRSLGDLVLRDLTEVIDRLFPEGSEPAPLDREAAGHEAFARQRARVYIGRPQYYERLDAHARGDGPPLVIVGEPGSGKSALLANWVIKTRAAAQPDTAVLSERRFLAGLPTSDPPPAAPVVLSHFVGATAASTDWTATLRRIIADLQRQAGIEQSIPDTPDALRVAFANSLHLAAAKTRVILVIDALDQFEDRDDALVLPWLPEELPANVRLVVATLPGVWLDELSRRQWPVLRVEPLRPAERQRLIVDHLAQSRKALSPERTSRIAAAAATQNPLFLRSLLEELRLHGDHITLDQRINYYLGARSTDELFGLILDRYEQDFEQDRPGLVKDTMSLLWAARRGLSEAELLDLLGAPGEPLPHAAWSPLLLAAEQWLVNRSGLLKLSHDSFRTAIRDRTLPTAAEQAAAHLRLADYFGAQQRGSRQVEEWPWQLSQARSWQRLYALLADPEFAIAVWRSDPLELKQYWAQVEPAYGQGPAQAYQPVIEHPETFITVFGRRLNDLARLLLDTGHGREAMVLGAFLTDYFRKAGAPQNILAQLARATWSRIRSASEDRPSAPGGTEQLEREAAHLGLTQGDLLEAMAEWLNVESAQADVLGEHAAALQYLGNLQGASRLLQEQERLLRQTDRKVALAVCLNNQATVLMHQDMENASALLKTAEQISRDTGSQEVLAKIIGNQALIYLRHSRSEWALPLLDEQQRIYRRLGDREGLLTCLSNTGTLLMERGELDRALSMFKEVEATGRTLGDKRCVMRSLGNQAGVLQAKGDIGGALVMFKEVERVARELGDLVNLVLTLGNEVSIFLDHEDFDGALPIAEERERLSGEANDSVGRAQALQQLSLIQHRRGDLERSLAYAREGEAIARSMQDIEPLVRALSSQALVLDDMGRTGEGLGILGEAERLLAVTTRMALASDVAAVKRHLTSKLHGTPNGPETLTYYLLMNRKPLIRGQENADFFAGPLVNHGLRLVADVQRSNEPVWVPLFDDESIGVRRGYPVETIGFRMPPFDEYLATRPAHIFTLSLGDGSPRLLNYVLPGGDIDDVAKMIAILAVRNSLPVADQANDPRPEHIATFQDLLANRPAVITTRLRGIPDETKLAVMMSFAKSFGAAVLKASAPGSLRGLQCRS
jgi:tetratricopeptide (TPR) repeat protein